MQRMAFGFIVIASMSATANPLGTDAVVHTLKFYDAHFLYCGPRTFTGKSIKSYATGTAKRETEWTELKEIKIEVHTRALTDADNADGIDWAGRGQVLWKFDRRWWSENGWSDWRRYRDDHQWDTTIKHYKDNRGWTITGAPGSYLDLIKIPGSCEEIPRG